MSHRILVLFIVVQVSLLVALGLLFRQQQQTTTQLDKLTTALLTSSRPAAKPASSQSTKNPAGEAVNATSLRRIVREELARQLATLSVAGKAALPSAGIWDSSAQQTTIDRQELNLEVTTRLDDYLARGVINTQEMEALLAQIAQLENEDRRAAFSRLTRAMNDGVLDAHF